MEKSDNEWMNKTVLIGNKDNNEKIKNENYTFNSPQSIQNNINIIYINQNKEDQSNLYKCGLYNFKSPEQNQKLFGKNKGNEEINDFQDKENQNDKRDKINISNYCNSSIFYDGQKQNNQLDEDFHEIYDQRINNRTDSSDSSGSKSKNEKVKYIRLDSKKTIKL